MVVAVSGPVAHHLCPSGLEGGVDLLHGVTEVLSISNGVSQAKDSHWLVLQVKTCSNVVSLLFIISS